MTEDIFHDSRGVPDAPLECGRCDAVSLDDGPQCGVCTAYQIRVVDARRERNRLRDELRVATALLQRLCRAFHADDGNVVPVVEDAETFYVPRLDPFAPMTERELALVPGITPEQAAEVWRRIQESL